MPNLSITKTFDDTLDFTEEQLDAIKSSLETFFNVTKIDSDNIQAGSLTTDTFADGSVTTAKMDADSVVTAKIADGAVTSPKIADDTFTLAKMEALSSTSDGSDPGRGGISQSADQSNNETQDDTNPLIVRVKRGSTVVGGALAVPNDDSRNGLDFLDVGVAGSASTYTYQLEWVKGGSSDWDVATTETVSGMACTLTTGGRPVRVWIDTGYLRRINSSGNCQAYGKLSAQEI